MPTIQLRFVEGGGWDSKVIRYTTRCRWSHTEALSEDGQKTFGAQLRGGVKWRLLADKCYRQATAYQTVQIPVAAEQYTRFWQFLTAQDGKPYDWRAILAFGMGNRDWRLPDAWFCSELDARGLELAGIVVLPKDIPVMRIDPRDLWVLLAGKGQAPDLFGVRAPTIQSIAIVRPTFNPVVLVR
jgi:hypothetical protein